MSAAKFCPWPLPATRGRLTFTGFARVPEGFMLPTEVATTSGMKAGLNGALNFSVLDGWWRESWNGKNGWAIGEDKSLDDIDEQDRADTESLFSTLENEIVPLYYRTDDNNVPHDWVQWVRESICTVAPAFSTRRMLKQYVQDAYAPLAQ